MQIYDDIPVTDKLGKCEIISAMVEYKDYRELAVDNKTFIGALTTDMLVTTKNGVTLDIDKLNITPLIDAVKIITLFSHTVYNTIAKRCYKDLITYDEVEDKVSKDVIGDVKKIN